MSKKNPVVHFEMPYENGERLSKFYSQVFGWDMIGTGPEMGDYILAGTTETDENQMVKTPGHINGGFFPKGPETPQHPSVVIAVENINESMDKIRQAGGRILFDPIDIPNVGKYSSFTDSEGNVASILQPLMHG